MGCYIAAEAARLVAEAGGARGDVLALAVTQEETGLAGARTSAFRHKPDVAVVVDVTHATDQPGVQLGEMTEHKLGSGPVIARATSLHPQVFDLLHDTAEKEGIPFTVESLARGTGTDADAIFISRSGVSTGLVSVPCRYMHSPVEMVSLGDIDAAARLIAAFAQALGARHLVRALRAGGGRGGPAAVRHRRDARLRSHRRAPRGDARGASRGARVDATA